MRASPKVTDDNSHDLAPDVLDAGGEPIDRALRLGAAAVGCPLIFTEAGSLGDAAGERFAPLPPRAFEHAQTVRGLEGEALGTLRAVDLASRPPLDEAARRAMTDVAALISGDIVTRRRVGETDHVTGLPNRRYFERTFESALTAAGADQTLVLVTVADAQQYYEILRVLGHARAENFVRTCAGLVAATVAPATVCHVGVLSVAFLAAKGEAEPCARALAEVFSHPVTCETLPITTVVGIGLAPLTGKARHAGEALRSALAAAQDSFVGERGYAFYDRRIDEAHARAFRLLTDLDEALRDYGQLSLAYQPRIDLRTGRTIGAEALVRWKHPVFGAVPPAEFVSLSETTALIGPLTDFVMTRACRQAAAWRRDGVAVNMSINVSPNCLHDAGFLGRVDAIFTSAGVDPTTIEFEFTEGTLTSSEAAVRETIDGVRKRGVRVAIDDFGMGYSNLNAITRLPADVLKIDRSLVHAIDLDPRRRRLCRSMVELAQDLDFVVVAEGVETPDVYDILARWRCDEAQGFFMSRPLPANDFAAFAGRR